MHNAPLLGRLMRQQADAKNCAILRANLLPPLQALHRRVLQWLVLLKPAGQELLVQLAERARRTVNTYNRAGQVFSA